MSGGNSYYTCETDGEKVLAAVAKVLTCQVALTRLIWHKVAFANIRIARQNFCKKKYRFDYRIEDIDIDHS